MGSDSSEMWSRHGYIAGYSKVANVVATTFFTTLVFSFYMAHYAWSSGFFTRDFTPLLAALFFASVLYSIATSLTKALTLRKDVVALVELVGAVVFLTVAAWFFVAFPLNFAHVADVLPAPFQFLLTWLTNDIGRVVVAAVLLAAAITFTVDVVKFAWRVIERQFRKGP
ncbi:hypothetical protein J2P12_03790 [Candidatus Bathyarchaeota archaeon]|nr:hypothetical protein [Candidatus Bathyarchaeota archaeon]